MYKNNIFSILLIWSMVLMFQNCSPVKKGYLSLNYRNHFRENQNECLKQYRPKSRGHQKNAFKKKRLIKRNRVNRNVGKIKKITPMGYMAKTKSQNKQQLKLNVLERPINIEAPILLASNNKTISLPIENKLRNHQTIDESDFVVKKEIVSNKKASKRISKINKRIQRFDNQQKTQSDTEIGREYAEKSANFGLLGLLSVPFCLIYIGFVGIIVFPILALKYSKKARALLDPTTDSDAWSKAKRGKILALSLYGGLLALGLFIVLLLLLIPYINVPTYP